jgi:hypothetical protein
MWSEKSGWSQTCRQKKALTARPWPLDFHPSVATQKHQRLCVTRGSRLITSLLFGVLCCSACRIASRDHPRWLLFSALFTAKLRWIRHRRAPQTSLQWPLAAHFEFLKASQGSKQQRHPSASQSPSRHYAWKLQAPRWDSFTLSDHLLKASESIGEHRKA